jgi:hypothetical protein
MRYKLMNEYSVGWPFWGGRKGAGLCAANDPKLPEEVSIAVLSWAAQFNAFYDFETGWPDAMMAAAHHAEGERIFKEVQRLLPEHQLVFQYWERRFCQSGNRSISKHDAAL